MLKNLIFFDEGAAGGASPDNSGGPEEGAGQQAQQPEPTPQDGQQTTTQDMVPYSRFKEMLDSNKTLTDERNQFEQELKTITEDRDGLQTKLSNTEKQNIRLQVAVEKGLPPELVGRLQGETLEDISKDADSLLSLIAERSKPKKSSVPPLQPSGEQNTFDISKATPDEIRAARKSGKLAVK